MGILEIKKMCTVQLYVIDGLNVQTYLNNLTGFVWVRSFVLRVCRFQCNEMHVMEMMYK